MKTRIPSLAIAATAIAALVLPASASAAGPCFTVSGNKVTVQHLLASGAPHVVDLEDMPSVSTIISKGSESHNLIFMNIKRDPAKTTTKSFSVKIDGKEFEYPKDACKK